MARGLRMEARGKRLGKNGTEEADGKRCLGGLDLMRKFTGGNFNLPARLLSWGLDMTKMRF